MQDHAQIPLASRKPRLGWSHALALGVLGVAAFGLWVYFSELRYQGRTLKYWTAQLKQGDQRHYALARQALQHFDARATQPLIDIIEYQNPPWKVSLLARFPATYRYLNFISSQDRAYAAAALGELGSAASAAIPVLEQFARSVDAHYAPSVEAALMKIKGIPLQPLIDSLADLDAKDWQARAHTVAEFGTNAAPAASILCRALASTNQNHRANAAYAIGFIRAGSAHCVPALIASAQVGGMDSLNSLWALGQFESEARSAIPLLRNKLNDADPMVRQSALGSLKRVLPPEELKTLLPALRASADDPDPNLRGAAKHMLADLKAAGVK